MLALYASVSQAQRSPVAISDAATIYENGSVVINVLANDSNFNAGDTVCLTAFYGPAANWASIQGCNTMYFHPLNPTFVGMDTFYYISCDEERPALCDTGRVVVTVLIRAPVALNDTVVLVGNNTDSINVLANDTNFNPPDVILVTNIWGAPSGWARVSDSAQVLVHSNSPGFYGVITFFYRSCDRRFPNVCDTGEIVVNAILPPKAFTDTATQVQPDTAYINVLANDSDLDAIDSACLTNIWNVPAGWASIDGCDQIDFIPTSYDFAGKDTFYYSSCYTQTPTVCDTGKVIVTVVLTKPQVDFFWTEDSPCVAQVYNNSLVTDSVKWTVQYLTNNGLNDTIYNVNQFPLSADMVDSGFDVVVCLTGYNPSGDSTVCYPFWIQCTVTNGIREISTAHLIVYPDPATDRIQIDISKIGQAAMSDVSSTVIYDMVGKELKTIPLNEIADPISVSDLSPGIYLIALLDSDQNKKLLGKFEVMR